MKNQDLLSTAIEAMRASDVGNAEFGATRARVLQTVHTKRVNRQRLMAALIVFGCVSVGSSAWAAVTGRLPAVLQVLGLSNAFDAPQPSTPSSVPTASRRHFARSHAAEAAAVAPILLPAPMEAAPSTVVPQPVRDEIDRGQHAAPIAHTTRAAVQAPQEVVVEQPLRVDPADALYREAHEAHFVAHDSALALSRWNSYLQTAPQGRFVPEAQYNRAICLVRLGRNAEAIEALRLIEARADGYRVHEAHELLEVLTRQ